MGVIDPDAHLLFDVGTLKTCLLWLGRLACCAQPWLGLARACLACLASNNNNGGGAAAAGLRRRPVVVAGKAGKTGPCQTKPRLGTTGKPAKPKQGGFIIATLAFQGVEGGFIIATAGMRGGLLIQPSG